MLLDAGSPLARLAAIDDAEELCRQLIASPGSWGSSTRHLEAVYLLGRVGDRVTSRLIAAIADSGLLGTAELDELAESFLSHEHVISYPLTWVSPDWLEVELDAGTGRTYTVNEDTLAQHRPSFEPPLGRWAAARVLRADPSRLDDLLRSARAFEPRHRDVLVHGLLDAADGLDENRQRSLIRRGLESAQATVRSTALDRLCALDGPESAWRRARADTKRRCASGDQDKSSFHRACSRHDGFSIDRRERGPPRRDGRRGHGRLLLRG